MFAFFSFIFFAKLNKFLQRKTVRGAFRTSSNIYVEVFGGFNCSMLKVCLMCFNTAFGFIMSKKLLHMKSREPEVYSELCQTLWWSLLQNQWTAKSRELFFEKLHLRWLRCLKRFWIRLWFCLNLGFRSPQIP